MSSITLSPAAVAAFEAILNRMAPAPTTPPTSGQPAPLADYWASDYPGKGVATRQLANGRWVDGKGVFCKAPTAAPVQVVAKPAAKVQPKAAPSGYTISQFAEEHPEVMADLKAAILGTVFTQGGSWAEFRTAVLGR